MGINPSFTPKTKSKAGPLIVMIVVAILLGLVAAGGIWQYLSKTNEQVKQLTVTRAVVVAAKKIQAGTKITEADLAIKQLPDQGIPKDYPNSIEGIAGRIAKTSLETDEIITEGRLVAEGAAGGLPVVIPKEYRAVTIRVNEVSGVGGFVNPGDHVDVISVVKFDEKETFSKTILQNVLVLAAGDKLLDPSALSESQPKAVSQVTFALNSRDAEKLILATEVGQVHLILRPITENKIISTQGISLQDVYGYIPGLAPQGQPNLPILSSEAQIMNSIEVILGDQRSYQYY